MYKTLKKGLSINISIIIPVFNEPNINLYLKSLLNLDIKNHEIIVVDGNNSSTIELIKDANIIKATSIKGRANQMNKGASLASNKILLFLHADTILPNNALIEIKNILKQEEIKAGAFDLSFNSKNMFLSMIAKTASLRSRLTRIPYGDQAIFIKRDIFQKIGTYENFPLMEDVNLMEKLKKENYKIEISKEKVITSSRKWDNSGILFTTLRNWVLISLYFLGVSPKKLAKFYN